MSQSPHDEKSPEKSAERTFIHDIATPVAVALGMIDLVLEDAEGSPTALTESKKNGSRNLKPLFLNFKKCCLRAARP